jgi:imidazolonepropionase-like amidohydrolase
MAQSAAPATAPIAIEHVSVLPMTVDGEPLRGVTVLIRGNRIEQIGPSQAFQMPGAVDRVDGSGKWLMPALSDMHVHVENQRLVRLVAKAFMGRDLFQGATFDTADLAVPYVAAGVLQVQNMSAMSEDIGRREEIESGRTLGPHMALAAMVDGDPPIWPFGMTRLATSPDSGRQAVRDIQAEGYDLVKTYSRLDAATFQAIVDEAARRGIRALGHIPERGKGQAANLLQRAFGMVAHAEEFAYQSKSMSDEDIASFVTLVQRNGTRLVSTMRTNEIIAEQARNPRILEGRTEYGRVHPALYYMWLNANPYTRHVDAQRLATLDRVVDFNRRLVRAFVRAGIPIVPGTDTIIPGLVPGVALHEELASLVAAGMSTEQALAAATRVSAEWLGVDADRGTVQVGKRADLLLLEEDPRADITNTRKIAAVVAGGRYLPRAELDRMVAALVKRYREMPPAFAGSGAEAE